MVEVRNYGERRRGGGGVLPFDEIASPKQDSSDNKKSGRVSGCLERRFQKKKSQQDMHARTKKASALLVDGKKVRNRSTPKTDDEWFAKQLVSSVA